MMYNPDIHHRRSIRLKGYDYSQAGLYFITICAHDRERIFGNIHIIITNRGTMHRAPTQTTHRAPTMHRAPISFYKNKFVKQVPNNQKNLNDDLPF